MSLTELQKHYASLGNLIAETKEAKGHALSTAVSESITDDTANRVLLYAESLALAECHLQIALVRNIRLQRVKENG